MALVSFLTGVFADGRARVGNDAELPEPRLREATALLQTFEREYRDNLPGTPPQVDPSAALYGAVTLYRVCQFLVFRDVEAKTIQTLLNRDFKQPHTAAVHYSVDLTLRFLPDAFKLTAGKASGDPLLNELVALANRWPLSSVGMPDVDDAKADEFVDDPCLLRLYADRIIAKSDLTRLNHPRVKLEVERAIGSFPELAPTIAESLRQQRDLEIREETSA